MKTFAFGLLFWVAAALGLRADLVEMQNGDRYLGKVLTLTGDSLVIQSDVLGKITLPRNKVGTITLGTIITAPPAAAAIPPAITSTTNSDPAGALRQLAGNTNLIDQVRGQFLAEAGPEANKRFDELLSGLSSGSLDINGLRAQAQASADQLRAYKGQLGKDAGESIEVYLDILDNFLKETAPANNNKSAK